MLQCIARDKSTTKTTRTWKTGGWPDQLNASSGAKRATAHVNPLPARKSSKRAKYGDAATANKERRLARSPKPPVVRPRPKRAAEYFQELIRSVEVQPDGETAPPPPPRPQSPLQTQTRTPPAQAAAPAAQKQHQEQQQRYQQREEQQPQEDEKGDAQPLGQVEVEHVGAHGAQRQRQEDLRPGPPGEPGPDDIPDVAAPDRAASSLGASTSTSTPAPAGGGGPAGFRRRRKLFVDSPDGPHPATTAKIVARLAACRHWRRPLAYRLLPRYLPLFDQHAAAYFFKHVPSLQPRLLPAPRASSPGNGRIGVAVPGGSGAGGVGGGGAGDIGGGGGGGGYGAGVGASANSGEAAGFRRMVVAVCCSLLPKMPSFGPRALACMAAGLGRMGISHGPTLAAWELHSTPQLALMRPDQLVASLEGWAELRRQHRPVGHAAIFVADDAIGSSGAGTAAAPAPGRQRRQWARRRRWRGGLLWRGRGREEGEEHQRLQRALPPLGAAWREAALAAAASALPRMTVAEVGRLLRALASLRLSPPPELLVAACTRVAAGVEEEAARLAAANGDGAAATIDGAAKGAVSVLSAAGTSGAAYGTGVSTGGRSLEESDGGGGGSGGSSGGHGGSGVGSGVVHDRTALLRVAFALAESAARRAANPYRVDAVGAVGGAVGIVAAAAVAAAAERPKLADRDGKQSKGQRRRAAAPPEPEPVRGRDVARVVRGLGELGHAPSPDWIGWLLSSVEGVLRWQLGDGEATAAATEPRQRSLMTARRGSRAMRPAASAASGADAVAAAAPLLLPWGLRQLGLTEGSVAAAATGAAAAVPLSQEQQQPAVATARFFSAEDLAELAAGLAELMPALVQPLEAAVPSATTASTPPNVDLGGLGGRQGAAAAAPLPPPVSADWLDLLLEVALDDVRRRLDPAAAAAAATAAAASVPTAILTQGDVTKAAAAAVAAAAGAAAAASTAAADCVPAASCLLTALFWLLPYYTPPPPWCAAAAGIGLELVPYMPPGALLVWLRSLATWGVPAQLPPAWHAAAAVHSRTQLQSYSAQELCELPQALAAAGARMPGPWAAQYVRQLVARLPVTTTPGGEATPQWGTTAQPAQGSEPSSRRHAGRRLQILPNAMRLAARRGRISGGGGAREGDGAVAAGAAAVTTVTAAVAQREAVALPDAAAALGWLPHVVPDLRYVGQCEGAALQALAHRFEVAACLPPPQSSPPQEPQPTRPPPGPQDAPQLEMEQRAAVAAFLTAAGWAVGDA